ncbi:type II toxin-antitoxin system HicB family antitoxin [Cyanobacterium aponinum UTEX 3221]|uniref:type II toxin-antitoxin system HicB family antitoxin n=1 Tax=Cyanobacterium aponinum TaxID=379064 RepID=UPI002B4C0F7A|nr:type II toxin-antitoxin system HicB family antitoxin [Cyanobacterium aponinum]WRL37843.1 type II toxin-antitoxin system HicB family antitoxin [Cyanobacterium aponinum UTEX 3221]
MNNLLLYPFEIKPLTKEEGGGYLISFPDFNECISDGETPEEAMKYGLDALQETINTLKSTGFPIPKPFSGRKNNDNFFQKIPENLYQRLETLAQKEKISINSLSK